MPHSLNTSQNSGFHWQKLLITTNLRLSEIAFDIGYNDPNYFSFLFKKKNRFHPKSIVRSTIDRSSKTSPTLYIRLDWFFRLANNARSKIVERTKSILASCLQPFVILFFSIAAFNAAANGLSCGSS